MANHWRAVVPPGALSLGGVRYGPNVPATLRLGMVLADAGTHTGRDVEVRFGEADLPALERLVAMFRAKVNGEDIGPDSYSKRLKATREGDAE